MKKHLCVDVRMWQYSGIGTYLQTVLPLLSPYFSLSLLFPATVSCPMVDACVIPMQSSPYSPCGQLELFRKTPSCDVFFSPHYNVPLLPIPAKKKIVYIHDLCPISMPEGFSWIKRKIAFWWIKQALSCFDQVLTPSFFCDQELRKVFAFSQAHVVPHGLPSMGEKQEPFVVPTPFFLYVGNGKKHKNVQRLVEAFSFLPSYFHLLLVGSDSYDVAEQERVHILGKVSREKLLFLYRQAHALVHPSLYEGFGFTPLEAMQQGCLVVASSAGAIREVCGEAALYVDPCSITSMYQGMKETIDPLFDRASWIKKGKARLEKFSWEQTIEQMQ